MKQPRRHTTLLFITLGIIAVVLLLIDMATGDTYIPIPKVWAVLTGGECDEMTRNILLSIRFIRVVVAGLIGIALSVSGLQMQTVFQNPLADPYLLGASSGAGLGVALFILGAPLLGWADFPLLQSAGIVGSGWIGTAVILLGVAIISRKVKNILGVLIMGSHDRLRSGSHHPDIAVSKFGGTTENVHPVVNGIAQPHHSRTAVYHDTGCVHRSAALRSLHQVTEPALAWRKLRTHDGHEHQTLADACLHLYSTADRNSHRLCGPVGFIGLAVPHITRLLFDNADHRILMPGTMLTGLIAMLICDIIAKKFLLPVNCITALLGVPVILWVIGKNLRIFK